MFPLQKKKKKKKRKEGSWFEFMSKNSRNINTILCNSNNTAQIKSRLFQGPKMEDFWIRIREEVPGLGTYDRLIQ